MKKILAALVALCLFLPGFTQQTTTQKISTEDYNRLIKQANAKRTTGIVLICAGSAMAVGGLFIAASGIDVTESNGDYTSTVNDETKVTTGAVISIAGVALGIGSIPLFVQSQRLRKQATLGLHATTINYPVQDGAVCRLPFTQVTLTVPLGK